METVLYVFLVYLGIIVISWVIVEVFFKVTGLERRYTPPTYSKAYTEIIDGSEGYRRTNRGYMPIKGEKD